MKTWCGSFSRILIAIVVLATMLGFSRLMRAQEHPALGGPAAIQKTPVKPPTGVPWDWTHHHVIFSHPPTAQQALRDGTYERWLKITSDPRYAMQQLRRGGAGPALAGTSHATPAESEPGLDLDLTSEGESAEAATPVREEDFPGGVLPRGLARSLVSPRSTQTELLSTPRVTIGPTAITPNSRLRRDWNMTEGNNGTAGLGIYPATDTSAGANCSTDFAVFNTGLAGSSSQASIIAFNQLYKNCNNNPPSTYWAYNTGGTIVNSVVLSEDGTQVAFVQSNASGVANLVVLKWASGGTLTSPTTLTSNSSYPSCTAPCMISLTLSGSPGDTYSSPFISYGPEGTAGTIYVGDDAGKVHKFINIFSASTPVETTTSPWPVTLNISTDAALGSPVYDGVSGNIFIGDYLANISSSCQPGISSPTGACGYLYSINASSGAVLQSAQLDFNQGIYDSPIVDSSAGTVYAFVGADDSTNCSSGPCAAVFQFPVGFTASTPLSEATVGAGYEFLMSGDFDNQYYTSANSTGHLYVVGGTGPQDNTLYAITINNNVIGSATAGPVVTTNYNNGFYAAGLQVSEFCNNGDNPCTATQGTDYLFLGVLAFGSNFSTNPCMGQNLGVGCIMGFTAPMGSAVILPSATPNGALQEAGGTSGIVVDNGASGASNIYFSTLLNQSPACTGGAGGCAVSATQAGLQ